MTTSTERPHRQARQFKWKHALFHTIAHLTPAKTAPSWNDEINQKWQEAVYYEFGHHPHGIHFWRCSRRGMRDADFVDAHTRELRQLQRRVRKMMAVIASGQPADEASMGDRFQSEWLYRVDKEVLAPLSDRYRWKPGTHGDAAGHPENVLTAMIDLLDRGIADNRGAALLANATIVRDGLQQIRDNADLSMPMLFYDSGENRFKTLTAGTSDLGMLTIASFTRFLLDPGRPWRRIILCIQCSLPFLRDRKNEVFCSRQCGWDWHNKRR